MSHEISASVLRWEGEVAGHGGERTREGEGGWERGLIEEVLEYAHLQRYGAPRAAGEELCVPFGEIERSLEAVRASSGRRWGGREWDMAKKMLLRMGIEPGRDWWEKLGGLEAATRRERARSAASMSASRSMHSGLGQTIMRAEARRAEPRGEAGGKGGMGGKGLGVAAPGKENVRVRPFPCPPSSNPTLNPHLLEA